MRPATRGPFNLLTSGVLLALAAVAYLGYAYGPHWLTNREVQSAMREAGYPAWRIHDDYALKRMIRSKTDRLVSVNDGTGDYAVIDEGMIEIEREGSRVVIRLDYEVPMRFPGTEKVRTVRFSNTVTTDARHPNE